MNGIFSIIRLLLLIVSCYGYIVEIRKKVRIEFSVGILFSSIGSLMFFAGILNILEEMICIILGGGLILALKSFYRRERIDDLWNVGMVFFFIMSGGMLLVLHGSQFTHYDNYSHWAIVVKSLLQNNRFPNFMDVNISFQSYPLGSASFIYYIAKVVGNGSEWMQMYAQFLLMGGTVISLFAFVKKWETKLLAMISSFVLLASNVNLTELLVDTLLPIIAVGAVAFCIYYQKELDKKIYYMIPYVVYLITIKNSGIFFVGILLIYALVCIERNKENMKKWVYSILCPILTLVLWQKHVKLVYSYGLRTKHSMSLKNFMNVFGEKSPEDVLHIVTEFMSRTISLSNKVIPILLCLILMYLFLKYIAYSEMKECRDHMIWIISTYVVYQIMLLGMYLFTMPGREALGLAEYNRYHRTILIFLGGMLTVIGIQEIERLKDKVRLSKNRIIFGIVFIGLICWSLEPNLTYYSKQVTGEITRSEYEKVLFDNQVEHGKRYLLLADSKLSNSDYYFHISRYLLNPTSISIYTVEALMEQEDILNSYDYLIDCDKTEETKGFVGMKFGEEQNIVRLVEVKK